MVAAVIVLYHPNLQSLKRLIESVTGQVDKIIVVDNTPKPSAEFTAFFEPYRKDVTYIFMGDNMGIATAQNAGIEIAIKEKYSHVLLLDHDSALPEGAVKKLLAAEQSLIQAGKSVAAVGPTYLDEKNGKRSGAVYHNCLGVRRVPIHPTDLTPIVTDYLIASGSLIRTAVLEKVGLMRDELFIDRVDVEWGFRAQSMGSCSYIVPSIVMEHSIGDSTARVFGREINVHNDARNYYIVRNSAYLIRMKTMSLRWRISALISEPKHILVHSWLSPHKWGSFVQMMEGVREGLTGRMRKFSVK